MDKEKKVSKETKEVKVAEKYTKAKLINAKQFANRKDILAVLIKDDEELSIEEATKRIDGFMKGKVK